MSNPTINILIGPNEQQRDAIVRGLRNQPYNAGCLLGRHMVAIRQVPRILAASPKSRQALAAELGRRLTAAKPEELRNMQELLNKEIGEYDDRNKMDIQRFVNQRLKVMKGEYFYVINI